MEKLPSVNLGDCSPQRGARKEVRYGSNRTFVRLVLNEGNDATEASVVEVSRSGMQLLMEKPVPVGALVSIEMARTVVQGEIRHCTLSFQGDSYRVGVLTHGSDAHP